MKHNGRKVSPMEFVGTKMANVLHAYASRLGPAESKEAMKLVGQWDRITNLGFQLNNPITLANMEKELEEELAVMR